MADVALDRLLSRRRNKLLAMGDQLTLRDLTQVLGAVTATRVMQRYGENVHIGSARGGEVGNASTAPRSHFEDKIARAVIRIGRVVDRFTATHLVMQGGVEPMARIASARHTTPSAPAAATDFANACSSASVGLGVRPACTEPSRLTPDSDTVVSGQNRAQMMTEQ